MVVSFGVAVVDPGLAQISGDIGFAITDVLNATSSASGTTADNDRILIRFFLRETSLPGKPNVPHDSTNRQNQLGISTRSISDKHVHVKMNKAFAGTLAPLFEAKLWI